MIARGVVGSLLVMIGGWLTAPLPRSLWLLHVTPLGAARDSRPGPVVGLLLTLGGMVLLVQAWIRLWRYCHGRLALVRVTALLWSAPLMLAPPLFSRDAWSYAAQGTLAALGISPYRHGPALLAGTVKQAVDPLWRHTPAPYGPLPLWWGDLLAHHLGSPLLLVYGHRLLAVAGILLLGLSAPRLAELGGVDPARTSALLLASPAVVVNGVAGLHNDILMVGLMAAALALTPRLPHGWMLGAALAGLAAAVKVSGGMVAVGVILLSLPIGAGLVVRTRRTVGVGALAGVVLLATGVVTGLGHGWVSALSVPFTVTTFSPTAMLGMPGRVIGTLLPPVLGAIVLLKVPTGRADRALLAVGVLYLAAVAALPAVRLWYLLWPLPFLAAVRLSPQVEVAVVGGAVVMGAISPMSTLPFGIVTWTGAAVVGVLVLGFRAGVGPWRQPRRTVLL
ncbi:MAG: polyprenol phosphomannose-dependent alpha 1,6 mannosyltransferase MptB [Nocardioidaceae bacterium]